MSAAEVIQLDSWRDPEGVLPPVVQRPPRVHGWHDLAWVAQTDLRDALRITRRLGMHTHLLYGLMSDGRCTCPHADCTGNSRGKHPVSKNWQTAQFDFDAMDARLLRDPLKYNLGWRMGPQLDGSTVVCFDIDGPRDLLAPLEGKFGALPETLTASSGKGLHYFFRLSADSVVPGNVKLGGIKQIDIRSTGGQVVIAPSRHYSGRVYRWTKCIEPAELKL